MLLGGDQPRPPTRSLFLHDCIPWAPSLSPQCPLVTSVHAEYSPQAMCVVPGELSAVCAVTALPPLELGPLFSVWALALPPTLPFPTFRQRPQGEGTEFGSLDYRTPKRGWLSKAASLLVVSGCRRRPMSRQPEAARESAGCRAPSVAALLAPVRRSRACEPGGDQLLPVGTWGCRPCCGTRCRWGPGQARSSRQPSASTRVSITSRMPGLAGLLALVP